MPLLTNHACKSQRVLCSSTTSGEAIDGCNGTCERRRAAKPKILMPQSCSNYVTFLRTRRRGGRAQGEGGAKCGEHLEHPAVAKISLAHVAGDSVMKVAGGTKTELKNVLKKTSKLTLSM